MPGVERHAAQPRRFRPDVVRAFHPGRGRADGFRIRPAGRIIHAVADRRPAVVLAGFGKVDLVAAARSVFAFPQAPTARIDREALHVAMAVTPDRLADAGARRERIVNGLRAIDIQPHQLALQHLEVLRHRLVVAFALADEDVAPAFASDRVEGDARTEMHAALQLRQLAVDHAQVGEPGIAERRRRDRGAGSVVVARFGVTQPDAFVRGVIRIEHDIEQPALAFGEDLRHAGDGRREIPVRIDAAQAARAFGNEESAVGQQCDRPGMFQSRGDGFDAHVAGFGRRGLRCRGGGRAGAGLRCAAGGEHDHEQGEGEGQAHGHDSGCDPAIIAAGALATCRCGQALTLWERPWSRMLWEWNFRRKSIRGYRF